MTTLAQEINRSSSPNAYIELFQLDVTVIGGADIFYFTPMTRENDTQQIVYQGISYPPFPVQVTGMESDGTQAAPPQPTLTVSNVNGLLMQDVLENMDMVGAKVARIRTFRNFLDD